MGVVPVGAVAGDCEAGVSPTGAGSAGCCAGAGASGDEFTDAAASLGGGGAAGASTPPSIDAAWAASVAAAGSCVLSLVTCLSGLAAAVACAGFAGDTEPACAGARAGEAALVAVAEVTFGGSGVGGFGVVCDLATTGSRCAPVLTGWERSLTITGPPSSPAAGACTAAGGAMWWPW